jgi:hypothetical protein
MMNPLELELKWERVWNYMTLDAVRTLQDELCIPGDLKRLQETTREALVDHYASEEFGTSSGLLYVRLAADLRSGFRENDLAQFFVWGDYLSDLVVSRVGEFFWMSALRGIEEVPHPNWLARKFSEMRADMKSSEDRLDRLVESLEFSVLDGAVLERVRSSQDSMRNYLALVTKYNLFARVWHQRMGQTTLLQLREVHAAGKLLAQKRNVAETAVCFPGFWASGPQCALLNLA